MAKKHLTSRHFFSVFPFNDESLLRLIYYLTSHLSREKKRKRKEFKHSHAARLRLNERGVLPAL